jgi:hypothetical protein
MMKNDLRRINFGRSKRLLIVKTFYAFAMAAALIATAMPVAAADKAPWTRAQVREVPYPKYGLEVGSGWNSFLGQRVPATCVDIMEIAVPKSEFSIDYDFIQDTYTYAKSYSHSGGGKFKGFGFKASVSASGTSQTRVNRDFLSALFRAEFDFGSTQAVPVQRLVPTVAYSAAPKPIHDATRFGRAIRLTPEAREMIENGAIGKFLQTCGDAFVLAVHRGVRVNVLATFNGTSQSEKQTFAASVSASGFGGAANFSTSGETDVAASNKTVKFQVNQEGGFAPLVTAREIKPGFDLARALQVEKLLEGQSSFSASILPYANLIDIAGRTEAIEQLTLFDRLDEQRALFYYLSDLEAILAEIDRAETLNLKEADRIYAPLHIQSMKPERTVARSRFQVFRLLRVLGGSIDACYAESGTCNPRLIKVPELEQTIIREHLDGSILWLTRQRDMILNRIKEREASLRQFQTLTSRSGANTLMEDLWNGATTSDILSKHGGEFALSFENDTLSDLLEGLKANDPAKSLISTGGIPGRLAVELPRVWSPGANGVDTSSLSLFQVQPDVESEIREELAKQLEELRAAIDAAREDLASLKAEAQFALRDIETYFAPLVDRRPDANGNCALPGHGSSGASTPGFAREVPLTSDLDEINRIVAVFEAAQPCSEISIGRWVGVLYNLASATPLTREQLDLATLSGSEEWGTSDDNDKPETLARRRELLTDHIRWKTYAERLYPFRESLCQTSIAESYCVNNDKLWEIAAGVPLTLQEAWLKAPAEVKPATVRKPARTPVMSSGCPVKVGPGKYIPAACP